ncbi:MAG: hypothetical protein P4L40_13615 [Terracidiphilus sp.]|nr:hypothetical protein [Terracidiphilus sp.]
MCVACVCVCVCVCVPICLLFVCRDASDLLPLHLTEVFRAGHASDTEIRHRVASPAKARLHAATGMRK